MIHYGPIPDGLYVLHDCDHGWCCNPAHLHLGTHADNMREASERHLFDGRRVGHVLHINPNVVRRRYAKGQSQQAIARALGIAQSSVSRIVRRIEHWATR
jgi:hypothetical protein